MSTGVNTNTINTLRHELLDYAEKVSEILNAIELEYARVKSNIVGTPAEIISNKYVTDLGNVVSAYDNQDQELSEIVISDANKMVEGS